MNLKHTYFQIFFNGGFVFFNAACFHFSANPEIHLIFGLTNYALVCYFYRQIYAARKLPDET